jgi:DNA protecting protein DprA
MTVETTTEVLAILQLLLTKGLGRKSLWRLFARSKAIGLDLSEAVLLSPKAISDQFALRGTITEAIAEARVPAELLLAALNKNDIQILVGTFKDYPECLKTILGDDAPPVLFAKGNISLLRLKSVGFCGSRRASEKGLRVTGSCAELLAEKGFNVVSGYANGVDLPAHGAALTSGDTTTFVLAEGILRFKVKAEVSGFLENEKYVAVSEFLPNIPWEAHNAMQRNKTICGLSRAMILIEAGLSGGTFAAGEEALKLRLPLFVVDYADPPASAEGNPHFLKNGAIPLRNGRSSLETLLDTLSKERPLQDTCQLQISAG